MQNININGRGTFSGGEYDDVIINGSGHCEEPVVCRKMSVNGMLHAGHVSVESLRVDGKLNSTELAAGDIKIDGMASVSGNLQSDALNINGNLTANGNISTGNVKTDGRLKCSGTATTADFDTNGIATIENGLFAQNVSVDGMLNVTGNIEATSVKSRGKISTNAQICADTIFLQGMVNADEIVGDDINICIKDPAGIAAGFLNAIFGSQLRNDSKCANLIEATTIRLENVRAGVVNGANVTIGPACTIDRVDCTGEFQIDPTSCVRILNGEPYSM